MLFEINEKCYEGLYTGQKWNNFEVPEFTFKVAIRILIDNHLTFMIDGNYNIIVDDGFETLAQYSPSYINGERYYSIGGYEWTWELCAS